MFRQFLPDVLHHLVAKPAWDYPAALIVRQGSAAVNTYKFNDPSSYQGAQ
ncbi:hypothetical protein IV500_19325 [Paeniglutamicibacter antarcticus]|uniref:Uncharacterized protein n=1 Tax=Arthrobacter terrae TaxID=2935737 RepID=A0A931CV48_9MICC|nr:hypothetical protein [Arthrobacter terrae]MBG0741519.1 hypothetical protein [Arthrobacter terrae]